MAVLKKPVHELLKIGIKYGPLAYQGYRTHRGSSALAPRQTARQRATENARGMAVEHAAHLKDGSILPVYEGDTRVWVVFSGDQPVATHPVVRTPMEQLLRYSDLDKRQRPEDVDEQRREQLKLRKLRELRLRTTPKPPLTVRPRPSGGTTASASGGPATPPPGA